MFSVNVDTTNLFSASSGGHALAAINNNVYSKYHDSLFCVNSVNSLVMKLCYLMCFLEKNMGIVVKKQ